MLFDARTLADGATIDTDICVIGAGPAGLTAGLRLAGAGRALVLLESGGEAPTREAQRLAAGSVAGYPYFDLKRARIRALGGSAHHWLDETELRARPLDLIDFRPAWSESKEQTWPISAAELEPHYREAHDEAGLGPFSYEPSDLGGELLPLPEPLRTVMFRFGHREAFTGRAPELAEAETVQAYLHATAVRMIHRDSRVEEVEVRTLTGPGFTVRAQQVVLAAGGIDNPRLLMLSGLGGDLVGRSFMDHLSVPPAVWVPSLKARAFLSATAYEGRPLAPERIGGMLGLEPAVLADEGLANAAFFAVASTGARASRGVRSLRRLLSARSVRPRRRLAGLAVSGLSPSVIRYGSQRVRGRQEPEVFLLPGMAEQRPRRESRVVLGDDLDPFGCRRPQLHWSVDRADRASIRRTQELIDQALRGAELGHLEALVDPDSLLLGQWHHMGTTRMSDDPELGVVDRHGRHHQLGNLYVTGSSVFPTAGFANPTLTIIALALRLADHLAAT